MSVQLDRHLLTAEAYHLLGEAGLLQADRRVELIHGEILHMSPIGSQHAFLVDELAQEIISQLQGRAVVRIQNPLRLSKHSEPEPDLAIVRLPRRQYQHRHPYPEDVLLVIEVADSSLEFDQQVKLPLYAEHEIPAVWIFNLKESQIEIHTSPKVGQYQFRQLVRFEEALTHSDLSIKLVVADLLS